MIYTLDYDLSHLPSRIEPGGYTWDVKLIRFEGSENAWFGNPTIDYTDRVPPVIEFVGELSTLEWSDFPSISSSHLLMSRKMLDVLLSIQPFKYRIYPTRIYSFGIEELVRYQFDGTRTDYQVEESSLYTDKFVIMQLAETTDVLDVDKIITQGKTARESGEEYFPDLFVEHYEFTKEEKDLPPVFTAENTPYFYTESAVRALEANNIRGVKFNPIPGQLIKTV